ncbi:MAG: hypothetical protein Q7S22_06080 [Candidatus Micrarchaeota archaeon]|nr:hypothetical protein [Candidatus Micrarchaeota archaeon]
MDNQETKKTEKPEKKKKLWFIEVIGNPKDTNSEAARKSMEMITEKLKKIKKVEEKGEEYSDVL